MLKIIFKPSNNIRIRLRMRKQFLNILKYLHLFPASLQLKRFLPSVRLFGLISFRKTNIKTIALLEFFIQSPNCIFFTAVNRVIHNRVDHINLYCRATKLFEKQFSRILFLWVLTHL